MADTMLFHIIVDEFHRTFTIDGPDGTNGVRLHLEMLRTSRTLNNKFRDFDLRMNSYDAVLAEMKMSFPGYDFLGSWASSRGAVAN